MKYGTTNTHQNRRRVGRRSHHVGASGGGKGSIAGGAKPSVQRYFAERRWLTNKARRIKRARRWAGRQACA